MTFLGQNNEDEVVYNYFKSKYSSDNFFGNVLDIGANDGKTLSNSFFLINNVGWKGFLVEAGKTPFDKLQILYANLSDRVNLYNLAIHNYNGVANFQESGSLLTTEDVGLVSSIILEETVRWRNSGIVYTEYGVSVFDWNTFISNFNLNDEIFDFISIDIEGVDYEVLSQIDLNKVQCKCLCVEFNGKDKQKYIDYVSKFGMILFHENPENLIFVK